MRMIHQDENGVWQLNSYAKYIRSQMNEFPAGLVDYLNKVEVIDLTSYKRDTMHSSWFGSICLQEVRVHNEVVESKALLSVRMPYLERSALITYSDVSEYHIVGSISMKNRFAIGHGFWLVDEFELTKDDRRVRHEILFSHGNRIILQFADVHVEIWGDKENSSFRI